MKLWETLKTMSFKEAVDYIWEYYKIHIIGIIAGLFILGSIISSVLKEDEVLYNMMVVAPIPYDEVNVFSDQINEAHYEDFEVAVDNIIYDGGDLSNQSYDQVQKLIAKIAAGMVDVMVTDESFALDLVEQEGLTPIEDLFDVEKLKQHGVEVVDFGSGTAYGIKSNKLDVFQDNQHYQSRVLVFPSNAEQVDLTDDFLEALLP
ncbi:MULTISPECIES: hypothetical protein [Gracilibacillus]|uniref:hypothetical protein n=1 Tax=Gracilibacillus TaxID=74385 RepID=UPI0006D1609F